MDAECIIVAVAQQIRSQIRCGEVSLVGVARALGMSVRTLQRMLRQEGTAFCSLANLLRSQEAAELLGGTDLPVSAISARLGYTSPENFARTCGRLRVSVRRHTEAEFATARLFQPLA